MSIRFIWPSLLAGLACALSAPAPAAPQPARHVLLISIDGMHGFDFTICAANGTCPNLAKLAAAGVNYLRASTTEPSDSFPGLMAIVSGGTPRLVGAYYDVAYDRVLAPPARDTGNGMRHGACVAGRPNGTRTEYEEGDDVDQSVLNGGGPYGPFDGGVKSIDPAKLVRDPFHGCAPVYPWNFVRANTIYGVIHAAGGRTAWADKHPAYAAVSGPTGTARPSNLDDFYAPEINSRPVDLPGVRTATGHDCARVPDAKAGDWTDDFADIRCYDQLKVDAVLNWIDGRTRRGDASARVPELFGMNFQAVSIGQKLVENGVAGGYADASGAPTAELRREIRFVDAAIGQMIAELARRHLDRSTTIVVTAKTGQAPVDPARFLPVPGHGKKYGRPPSAILGSEFLPASELGQAGPTEDDVSLLWLRPGASVEAAVRRLEAHAGEAHLGRILHGPRLAQIFGAPGLPANGGDPRTPDLVVVPDSGVVYTASTKKHAEHGGFSADDTDVILLVSSPAIRPRIVSSAVETTQIAPTVLRLVGLNPHDLEAVRVQATPVLPGLGLGD